jgi:hypothetical protein
VPSDEGHSDISPDVLRLRVQHFPIPHLNPDGLPAVKAGGVDPDYLAWKQPADRQRFEASLAEPLLLAVDSDAVLSGKVAERREAADVICFRKKPPKIPAAIRSCNPFLASSTGISNSPAISV